MITDSKSSDHFNLKNAMRLAEEIYPFQQGCILVHGTGSIGKPPAIQYGYVRSRAIPKEGRLTALAIREKLRRLNSRVVQTFQSLSISAFGMDIHQFYDESCGQHVKNDFQNTLKEDLDNHRLPVFYGDMICRKDGSFEVVSSDFITLILAKIFHPDNVIFLTDVPGVYQGKSYDNENETIIPLLTRSNVKAMQRSDNDLADVSGGMGKKVEIALQTSLYCNRCFIGSGYQQFIVRDFLTRRPVIGTIVKDDSEVTYDEN